MIGSDIQTPPTPARRVVIRAAVPALVRLHAHLIALAERMAPGFASASNIP
jgi:hypothetical protein